MSKDISVTAKQNSSQHNHLQAITAPIQVDKDQFHEIAKSALRQAREQGATQAAMALSIDQGVSITVRNAAIETLEAQQDQGFGVTVYVGKHKGTASTTALNPAAITETVSKAISIAKFTVEDEYAGLADADLMATDIKDLDLFHPWTEALPDLIERAKECESSARDFDERITNSEGASVNTSQAYSLYANSHGFVGDTKRSSSSTSVSVIAEDGEKMERDYWYDYKVDGNDLESAIDIGKKAGERTIRRLNPRKLSTRKSPILFVPEMARGLFSAALGALSGSSQYRQSSFLLNAVDEKIFPDYVDIRIEPHLLRSLASKSFDSEGVATYSRDLIKEGIVQGYILGSYSARKLGLKTTANAGGVQNVLVKHSDLNFDDLLKEMDTGLVVTEMMGQGVNGVTGDYSRGAAGFWIEKGVLQYPVAEITIAGNLKKMYQQIVSIGNDVDTRAKIRTGSVLIEEMTIAGN